MLPLPCSLTAPVLRQALLVTRYWRPAPQLIANGEDMAGQIIVLNGTPRAGKSSIAHAIQDGFDGVWMNLGLDKFKKATPERFQPGIGLRPGGERPDLEPLVKTFYLALYQSVAAHSRLDVNVVVDATHHDHYSQPLGILRDCARVVSDLPVLFVGVRCARSTSSWNVESRPGDRATTPTVRFRRR